MNKTILLTLIFLASCASPKRFPAFQETKLPTAEELFLVGKFQVKKKVYLLMDENNYGKDLDLSERRPVVPLEGTVFEEKYGLPEHRLFANFFHKGKFWIARVPKKAVEKVYVQLSYFPPILAGKYVAAHSLIRFELNESTPLRLVAEMPTVEQHQALQKASPEERLDLLPEVLSGEDPQYQVVNIAMSAEAQWTKDDPKKEYNLVRGKHGAFTQIIRIVSMDSRLREFFKSGNPVNQFEMKGLKRTDGILTEAILSSQRDGISKLYDTLWYNCTTMAFDILERGEGSKDKRFGFVRSFMQRRIPVIAPDKIKSYGDLEVVPMSMDVSLKDEISLVFQEDIVKAKRPLCPESMKPKLCATLQRTEQSLREWGMVSE